MLMIIGKVYLIVFSWNILLCCVGNRYMIYCDFPNSSYVKNEHFYILKGGLTHRKYLRNERDLK